MGRKTFESLGRPLPNRFHIVVTQQSQYKVGREGTVVHSLEEAFQQASNYTSQYGEEVFVIGGGEIYKESLDKDMISTIYITRLEEAFEGDAFYPKLSQYPQFQLVEERPGKGPVKLNFYTYKRIKP